MIGVFDSGSGGLTVLKKLREALPSADILYFGDIANAPYGERSQEELSRLTIDAIRFLRERGADKIVSACNSTSASLALSVFDAFSIAPENIIEMVGPTVSYLKGFDARLLVCATPATIRSGIYQNAFRMVGKDISVLPIAGLAGAIEFGAPPEEIEQRVREAFSGPVPVADVVVLACTHYPLVLDVFTRVLEGVELFDPAQAVAERARQTFLPQEVGDGHIKFLVSKESAHFRRLVGNLFPDAAARVEVIE